MALTEVFHTEDQVSDARRVHFVRRFEGIASDLTLGAGGWTGTGLPAVGDAFATGTWTNKITPRCYRMVPDANADVEKVFVLAHYSAYRTQGTASGTLIELDWSRDHAVNYKGEWRGYRRYGCPDADAETHRATLSATTWTINSVAMRPYDVQVEKDPMCPGISILTCHFHWVDNPSAYQTGRATLEVKDDPIIEELTHGIDANGALDATAPINAPDATEPYYWKLVQGSNVKKTPRRWLVVKAGFSTANLAWSTWEGWADKLNTADLSLATYPTIGAGTLKFHTAEVPPYAFLDPSAKVVPVRFIFEHRPNGFPVTKAQKFVRLARKEYAVTENDDPNGTRDYMKPDGTSNGTSTAGADFRLVWQERKVGDPVTRTITKSATADFTSLYSILAW